jgi:cytosine/adenosine deaminase-related metal-dependent hydrolase
VKTLLTASWVAPMEGPILRDAGIVHEAGRIVAVGTITSLKASHPDATIDALGDAVLLPGLINAHTHLELSDLREDALRPTSFVDWLLQLMQAASQPQEFGRVHRATEIGIAMSLRSGVTCVGDVSRFAETTRRVLKQSQLRCVSFGEVTGMAGRREFLAPRLQRATQYSSIPTRLLLGISPHAPYSIEEGGYRLCLREAESRGLRLTTHLAETADEDEFLSSHSGPFRELWDRIGGWDEHVPVFHGGPVRYARAIGLLDFPTLLAHVNYCDDADLALLAHGRASVVYCPRTHRYFGHPPHRWREMLAAGINVAVGTDSCASSPDLNLVDDLRLVHKLAPDVDAQTIWSLATQRAARALQMDGVIGTIAAGKAADFVAFESHGSEPLAEVLEDRNRAPRAVWIDGKHIGPSH